MITVTFLGTSGMVPTKERNVQSICIEYKGEYVLVDCGEGTQRQMNIAGLNRMKVKKVLISHWHGDHVSGLIGLIQTIGNGAASSDEQPTLHVYGPETTREHIHNLLKSCVFEVKIDLQIHEIKVNEPSMFYENEDYELWASQMRHSIPCLGFAFVEKDKRKILMAKAQKYGLKEGPELGRIQQGETITFNGRKISPEEITSLVKGKKIVFITDTDINDNAFKLAQDADLLVSESSFSSQLEEKADRYKHMTAKNAALIANKSNVKELILTHFSQRYKTSEDVLHDAKDYFQNTKAAFDFMKVKL
ncbi:MAG: ribonuclease Z [Candidatus Woesearchaeota archaeon]